MATNPPRMTTAEVRATRKQVTHLMRHPEDHPAYQQRPLIHYALDLESPPVLACETHMPNAESSTLPESVTCRDCMATEHFPRLQAQPIEAPIIRPYAVLMNAADLLSDDGENPEYDRAIAELTASLIGTDDTELIARILRALKQGEPS